MGTGNKLKFWLTFKSVPLQLVNSPPAVLNAFSLLPLVMGNMA